MQFFMPVRVYQEDGCVKAHSTEICALGKRALIVTGRSSAEKNGSLSDVKEALRTGNVTWAHFNEIEENPSVETVMKARDFGIAEGVDFVIGIGGGSPMDAAKAIALMLRHPDRDAAYLYDAAAETSTLPIVLIPTTCGTGSEVTAVSVLTRHDLKTKQSIPHKIFADVALIDARYLENAPHKVLADTTMDALAHLTESYIHTAATDYSRMCVDAGLKLWRLSADVIAGKREATAADYANMLNASMFAGMAIAHTGTSLPHGLSYAFTYQTGTAHGKACGYFLPGYLQAAGEKYYDYILGTAGFSSADALKRYYESTCGMADADRDVLMVSVEEVLRNPKKTAAAPFAVDETVLKRIAGI